MQLIQGDCLEVLKTLSADSVDSIVTDPPAGISFMGKEWDKDKGGREAWIAWMTEVAKECLRVIKPGGHALVWAIPRTSHWTGTAWEQAGWEPRDKVYHVFGCLDEQTEVVTKDGVKPYTAVKAGDVVLCYNTENGEYSYQPILEVVVYDYKDTAYRLIGDFGEQVVSRNHRVIVEQGGKEVFRYAELLGETARIPVLENLSELQQAFYDKEQRAGTEEQVMQQSLYESSDQRVKFRSMASGRPQGQGNCMSGLREGSLETRGMAELRSNTDMQQSLQWGASWAGLGEARLQGSLTLEAGVRTAFDREDDWGNKSGLERWADLPQSQRSLRKSANQVRKVSAGISSYGTEGRLRNGAPDSCCPSSGESFNKIRSSSSHQSRCNRQQTGESDVVCDERATQGIRGWQGHQTAVVRVVPFEYTGKVWCLRVPTGAFVAVRNGVAFATGNSGFPKSADVSKHIDKKFGAEREVIGKKKTRELPNDVPFGQGLIASHADSVAGRRTNGQVEIDITAPATDEPCQWQGWGTALKPAVEEWWLFRKPLRESTTAGNVLALGTGALNIDACRVTNQGRWPAHLTHDGSEEVKKVFPQTGKSTGGVMHATSKFKNQGGGDNWRSQPKDSENGFGYGDSGSAARYFSELQPDEEDIELRRVFYHAKASKKDRDEGLEDTNNKHPTVKNTTLMKWLCRLITPPSGVVLDPFTGSGSTGKAAVLEGFDFIGIEYNQEYLDIAKRRIEFVMKEQS